MKFLISLFLLLSPCIVLLANPVETTMAQLEQLALGKSYGEALFRLDEIPSGQRDAKWDALLERVALGYLGQLSQQGKESAVPMTSVLLQEHPKLRRSEKFMQARAEIGIEGGRECYENRFVEAECPQRLVDFFKIDHSNLALLEQALEVLKEKGGLEQSGLLIQYALDLSEKSCQKPIVQQSIIATLGETGVRAKVAKTHLQRCWNPMRAPLLAELKQANDIAMRANICTQFADHKEFPKACQIKPAPKPSPGRQ